MNSNKGKIILEFADYSYWNPILYLTKDNKKRYNIVEDGFKYLTDEQRNQIYLARVRSKESKLIGGLINLRELEIFDDIEPKTDIKNIVCYFNSFKNRSQSLCHHAVGYDYVLAKEGGIYSLYK